jgi:PhnB protein
MPMLDSYLFFGNGKCAEAMRFYERTLGGKIDMMMTWGESPDPGQCPAGMKDQIMHSSLTLDGRTLMACDSPPESHQPMGGFSLSLNYEKADEARRIFDKLADGGSINMPMNKTFWADAFGMLTDKYGTPWMVMGGMQAKP